MRQGTGLTEEEICLLKEGVLKAVHKTSCEIADQCFRDHGYLACVSDILKHPKFLQMGQYIQHGTTTTLEHCLGVSYLSYRIARSYRLDYWSAARGGLLHDLFLYDWHYVVRDTGNHLHGLTHPKTALLNATKYFSLNEREKDIIRKHMWPITIELPRYAESYVVTYADKYCGLVETVNRIRKDIRVRRNGGFMYYGYHDGHRAAGNPAR